MLTGEISVDVTVYQGDVKEFVCNRKTDAFFNLSTGNDTSYPCVVGVAPQ